MVNRRTFLKGATLAAGCGFGIARAAETTSNDRGTPARMTLSIETDVFRNLTRTEAFTAIREAGYRFIEIKARDRSGPYLPLTTAASDELLAQWKWELGDAGLTPIAVFIVHHLASSDEPKRREAVAAWRRSIDMVQRMGLKLVTTELTGDRARPQEGETAFRKSLDELLPLFEAADIHVSVEPHTADFFETAAPTIKLLRSYRSRHLGYLHVIPHTFILGNSMRQVIHDAGPLLTHVHVADTLRPERFMVRGQPIGPHLHAIPGMGEVDFRETFDALAEIGYRGYASCHLISHMDRPKEAAVRSREYLKDLLGDKLRM
jgi:myo-inositol catabolism protein IolH